MRFKSFSLITLIGGVVLLTVGGVSPLIALQNYTSANGAIGIIGGADIPTYQFVVMRVMNGWPFCLMLFGISFVITALFCLIFSKTVKSNCTLRTSAISIVLSAVGAMGMVCVILWFTIVSFHKMSQHPITYPTSILLGLLCFLIFFILIALYFKFRKSCWSVKGFVVDIFTSIIYLPTFFFAFSYLYEILS